METNKMKKVTIGIRTPNLPCIRTPNLPNALNLSGLSYSFAELDRLGFCKLQQCSRYLFNISNKLHNRS
jgi:hypothetical protein